MNRRDFLRSTAAACAVAAVPAVALGEGPMTATEALRREIHFFETTAAQRHIIAVNELHAEMMQRMFDVMVIPSEYLPT